MLIQRLIIWLRLAAVALVIILAATIGIEYYRSQNLVAQYDGAHVGNFALLDHEGNYHELYHYSNQKAVVLISQGNGCPIIRKMVPYLNALQDELKSFGVTFLMLNANPQDDRASIAAEVKNFNIQMPVLDDATQSIARTLAIARTAEAIVMDPRDWTIVYRGAIHDGLDYEIEKKLISRQYLKDALIALLTRQPIRRNEREAKGCLINFNKPPGDERITYTQDVAPILQRSCVPCHRQNGVAPWSMDDYETVKGWGAMMGEVIRTKRMPPWQADPNYGHFSNDISLSREETTTMLDWINAGFPRGEGEDPLKSQPNVSSNKWYLGKPDLEFTLNEEQHIPALGADEFRVIEANKIVEEDIWLKAIAIKPQNPKVVHHLNIVVELPDGETNASDTPQKPGGLTMENGAVIAGYAPGNSLLQMPPDTGIFIPKGSKLIFRPHYVTTGRPEVDLTSLGLYVYQTPPSKKLMVATINNRDINIPPGAEEYKRSAQIVMDSDAVIYSLQPHMHYRGKSMKFIFEYPDGRAETVLSVPNYRFQWQWRYYFEEPKRVSKGTVIRIEGAYDNSAQNPDNPDPSAHITYGPYSQMEMFQGIVFYTENYNK